MKIIIESCSNGAIVNDIDNNAKSVFLYNEEQIDGLIDLLWEIRNKLLSPNDFAEEQIGIIKIHGDEHEHKNKKEKAECKICNPE